MTPAPAENRFLGLRFPPLVWMMLVGTLVTRTAFFMVWPFLAVILARDFHLPPARVGLIVGAAFLTSGLVGFYSGNLSDRFGRRRVMTAGCVGAVGAYVLMATAESVVAYAAGSVLVGLTRAALESPGGALIGDQIEDTATRQLALHVRYFLINLGGAVGPLAGLFFGLSARQSTFWVTAAVYLVYMILLDGAFRRSPEVVHPEARARASMRVALGVLRRDRRFLLLVAANFLTIGAYAQQESTLVQYLGMAGTTRGVGLVTALLMTNAVTIIVFQFPLLRLLERYGLYARTYIGLTLFGAAFLAYAVLPVTRMLPWVVVTWVLSVGEAIVFPTLQLQTDSQAHGALRGSYFGAAALGGLGFGVGPIVGGYLLGRVGGGWTFALTALSVGFCGLCYWQSSRCGTPTGPSETVTVS